MTIGFIGCRWQNGSMDTSGEIAETGRRCASRVFRKGRGCMDMIFTIRQLVEKVLGA